MTDKQTEPQYCEVTVRHCTCISTPPEKMHDHRMVEATLVKSVGTSLTPNYWVRYDA